MSDNAQEQKGFYEAKGMVRHMVILTEKHRDKLKKIAKTYGIKQGDVVEVLMDTADLARIGSQLEAKKKATKGGTTTKTELVKKMKDLTPEQIAQIEAIISQGKSEE